MTGIDPIIKAQFTDILNKIENNQSLIDLNNSEIEKNLTK